MQLDPFFPEYLEKYLMDRGFTESLPIHLRVAPARLEQGFILITSRPVDRSQNQKNQFELEAQICRPDTDTLALERFNAVLSDHFADRTDIVFEAIDLDPSEYGLPDDFAWPAIEAFACREATPPMIYETPVVRTYEAVVNLRFQFDLQELIHE